LNGRDRSEWYPKVVEDSVGEFCRGCGKSIYHNPKSKLPKWTCKMLYIDHIDNDPTNTVLKNLQLLCSSCNRIKNHNKKQTITDRPKTPEMMRGDDQELEYRDWIRKQIVQHDWVADEDCIDAGAEYLTNFQEQKTISPVTTRRYLKKLTSTAGDYTIHKGWVTFTWKLPQLVDWLKQAQRNKDLKIEKMNEIRESFKEELP